MKLTSKDKEFLERLRLLLDERDLRIELKHAYGDKRLVLRGNYGDRIERAFGLTRQGVRWRFQRLFNQIYAEAYETIFWVESTFGVELRSMVMEVAHQRAETRRKENPENSFGPVAAMRRK